MNKTIKFITAIVIVTGLTMGSYLYWSTQLKQIPLPTVKVGVLIPLSGDTATYGFDIKKGIDFAKKELSADQIELIYEDGGCDPIKAKTGIKNLIDQKVVAIIGEICSSASLAIAPLANEAKIPLISPGSTSPQLSTDGGEYFFRTVPSDAFQGKFGAELVYSQGLKKLAIIHTNEAYGTGFKDILKTEYEKMGGEVVLVESIKKGSTNLLSNAQRIKSAKPDAVYVIANSPTTSGAALKYLYDADLGATIFGAEGLHNQEILNDIGKATEGLYVTGVSLGNTSFLQRYRIEYSKEQALYAAQAYDAFTAIIKTLQQGAIDGQSIKENLLTLEFEGVSGTINFDENGDVSGIYDIYQVQKGKFVLVVD